LASSARLLVAERGTQLVVDQDAAFREPVAVELRDLLFQRHAREQIGDPLLGRQLRVQVLGLGERRVARDGRAGRAGRKGREGHQEEGVRSFHARSVA